MLHRRDTSLVFQTLGTLALVAWVLAAPAVHASSWGVGAGWVTGEVSDSKLDEAKPFSFSSPALHLDLSTSGEPAQPASGLRVVLAHGGTFELRDGNAVDKTLKWRSDDNPDLLYVQIGLVDHLESLHPLASLASLSVDLTLEGQGGYVSIQDASSDFDAKITEAWLLFPISANLAYTAPLGLKVWGGAGYDPITGLASLWYKNVHQAWRWGVGAQWHALKRFSAEIGWGGQATNISDEAVWNFYTTALTLGARIGLD